MKTLNQLLKATGVVTALFFSAQITDAKTVGLNSDRNTNIEVDAPFVHVPITIDADVLWFPVTINGLDDTDHSGQQVSDQPTDQQPSGDCDPANSGKICSVKLDVTTIINEMEYTELKNRINDTTNPATIQDFLDLGATFEEYSRELTP